MEYEDEVQTVIKVLNCVRNVCNSLVEVGEKVLT